MGDDQDLVLLDEISIQIQKNYPIRGIKIFEERYVRREKGRRETPAMTMWRVARCVAHGDVALAKEYVFKLLASNRFLPNTPTWTGAGVGKGQLAACFVLPIEDTMESIFGTLRDAALIQSTGGGTGFTFGHLRPSGSLVNSSQGTTCGPVSFIGAFDSVFGVVQQGGSRRGANMAVLPVSHPDILKFIRCKEVEGKISNFNLSVSIPNSFMKAVESKGLWEFVDPSDAHRSYGSVDASNLFDEIVDHARRNGEPGVIFIDTVNDDNPLPNLFRIEATNPCVTGDTVINTSAGPQYAKTLVGVDFHTPEGVFVPRGFFVSDNVKVVANVRTRLGFGLRCTLEHRLMTTDGWKRAKDLTSEDSVLIGYGTYKCGVECMDASEFPNVHHAQRIADDVVGGMGYFSGRIGEMISDAAITALDRSTFRGALTVVREMWVSAGRPEGRLVFKHPVLTRMLASIQLMMLRLGVVCTIECGDGETVMMPLGDFLRLFNVIVGFERDVENNVNDVWDNMKMGSITDAISIVENIGGRDPDGGEFVYDASCDPEAGRPVLWTNAFLSHNCSEVPLSPYESCCLGSINLRSHVRLGYDGRTNCVDWHMLEETTHMGVHFLNNVIMANKFVPSVPLLEITAKSTMRIGLGIMGLADLFFKMNVRYGSPESISIASQLMEFIRYHAMLESIKLSVHYGTFDHYPESTYMLDGWKIPRAVDFEGVFGVNWKVPHVDIGRPNHINWEWLSGLIESVGIRNITTTAVAPTGTISLVAGVCGFGCEPVFALAHRRRVLGLDGAVRYENMLVPELTDALDGMMLDPDAKRNIVDGISRTGSCQNVKDVPDCIRNVFVCASDVDVTGHVMMQAALQAFVDGAISKTINLPPNSSADSVRKAMLLAWRSGCKGICVYVAGSRNLEVLTAGVTIKPECAEEEKKNSQ